MQSFSDGFLIPESDKDGKMLPDNYTKIKQISFFFFFFLISSILKKKKKIIRQINKNDSQAQPGSEFP